MKNFKSERKFKNWKGGKLLENECANTNLATNESIGRNLRKGESFNKFTNKSARVTINFQKSTQRPIASQSHSLKMDSQCILDKNQFKFSKVDNLFKTLNSATSKNLKNSSSKPDQRLASMLFGFKIDIFSSDIVSREFLKINKTGIK